MKKYNDLTNLDSLVKSRIMPFFWIPAYAGMTISGLISGKYGTRRTREGGYPVVKMTFYEFINLKCQDGFLVITIDGESKKFPLKKISPALGKASEAERNNFEISPSGYGIHWPLLDEDLSIDALLGIVHVPRRQKTIA